MFTWVKDTEREQFRLLCCLDWPSVLFSSPLFSLPLKISVPFLYQSSCFPPQHFIFPENDYFIHKSQYVRAGRDSDSEVTVVGGQGGRTDLPKTTVLISWETVLEHKFPSS